MSLYTLKLKVNHRRDRKRTSDVFISLFVFAPSLSLHVFFCLSLSIHFQAGWPTLDKQKEEDLLSSFSNSPFTLSLSLLLTFKLNLSFSLPLHPLSLSFLNLPLLKQNPLNSPPPPHLHNLITKTCREERDRGGGDVEIQGREGGEDRGE